MTYRLEAGFAESDVSPSRLVCPDPKEDGGNWFCRYDECTNPEGLLSDKPLCLVP